MGLGVGKAAIDEGGLAGEAACKPGPPRNPDVLWCKETKQDGNRQKEGAFGPEEGVLQDSSSCTLFKRFPLFAGHGVLLLSYPGRDYGVLGRNVKNPYSLADSSLTS